jgi:hypothetical protein
MDRVWVLFAVVGLAIPVLILGGLYSDALNSFLARRIPQLEFEGDRLLLWGMLVLVAFVLGMIVMYMTLYP